MQPHVSYLLYQAIKLHFETDNYDCIKYNYKTSATEKTFFKRRDKYHFAKVSKRFNNKEDIINFLVANFIDGKTWIGDMIENDDSYQKWQKRHQSQSYALQGDIDHLLSKADFKDWFTTEGQMPFLLSEYMGERISIDTVCILERNLHFWHKFNTTITDPLVWPTVKRTVTKYNPFLKVDDKKMQKVLLNKLTP